MENKKYILILKGCPCSGKSTWTKEFLNDVVNDKNDWVVINRDTYRYQIGNGKYTMDHEDEVTEMEKEETNKAIKAGKNLIIDNTNLNSKYTKVWYDLAEKNGYEISEKEFYIPYKEAMKRSKARRDAGGLYIPRDVMRRFYRNYYKEKFEEEMSDPRIKDVEKGREDLSDCVICDLDGTFALHNGREPFEWDKIPTDIADFRLSLMLWSLQQSDVEIIFLTGRPQVQGNVNVRELTENWLEENDIHDYILLMRDPHDFRSGEIVKKEQYEKYIKGKYNVLCVFEDSNKCVEMWRNEGLLCLQPFNGDY